MQEKKSFSAFTARLGRRHACTPHTHAPVHEYIMTVSFRSLPVDENIMAASFLSLPLHE